MDRDLAITILSSAYRSASELVLLAPVLKDNLTEDDHLVLGSANAKIIYEIHNEIIKYIYSQFPDIEAEVDKRMSRFGRAF